MMELPVLTSDVISITGNIPRENRMREKSCFKEWIIGNSI